MLFIAGEAKGEGSVGVFWEDYVVFSWNKAESFIVNSV